MDGSVKEQDKHGGNGGKEYTMSLDDDEYIIAIYGKSGGYIDSIQFRTNKKTYSIFGGNGGKEFRFEAPSGYQIIGFFGRSGGYVDALGCYLKGI